MREKVHMHDLHSETCLVTLATEDDNSEGASPERPTAPNYGFVTECFFLTHRAIDLGVRVVHESLLKVSQELARTQRTFRDAQASASSPEVLETIKSRMQYEMVRLVLIFTAIIFPPKFLIF